ASPCSMKSYAWWYFSRRLNSLMGSSASSTRRSTILSAHGCPVDLPRTIRMAADCLPRMSPPWPCAASSASTNRSANLACRFSSYARAIAGHTVFFSIRLACAETSEPRSIRSPSFFADSSCPLSFPTAHPASGISFAPVKHATFPWESTMATCRESAWGSTASNARSASFALLPARSRSSPSWPYPGSMNDCVAIAPTPASAHVTSAPTANQCDCTATPRSPVCGSRATIENVCTGRTALGCCANRRVGAARHKDASVRRMFVFMTVAPLNPIQCTSLRQRMRTQQYAQLRLANRVPFGFGVDCHFLGHCFLQFLRAKSRRLDFHSQRSRILCRQGEFALSGNDFPPARRVDLQVHLHCLARIGVADVQRNQQRRACLHPNFRHDCSSQVRQPVSSAKLRIKLPRASENDFVPRRRIALARPARRRYPNLRTSFDVREHVIRGRAANHGLPEDQRQGFVPPPRIGVAHELFQLLVAHLGNVVDLIRKLRPVGHGGVQRHAPVGFLQCRGHLANGVGRSGAIKLLGVVRVAAKIDLFRLPGLQIRQIGLVVLCVSRKLRREYDRTRGQIESLYHKHPSGLVVPMVFTDEYARKMSEHHLRPRQSNQTHKALQVCSVSPVGQRIQQILRGGILAVQEPHQGDAQLRAGLACLNLPLIRERRSALPRIAVCAASATRAENNRNALVQVVDCPRQVRREKTFVVRMRHDHQNIRFVPLVRTTNDLRRLRKN